MVSGEFTRGGGGGILNMWRLYKYSEDVIQITQLWRSQHDSNEPPQLNAAMFSPIATENIFESGS